MLAGPFDADLKSLVCSNDGCCHRSCGCSSLGDSVAIFVDQGHFVILDLHRGLGIPSTDSFRLFCSRYSRFCYPIGLLLRCDAPFEIACCPWGALFDLSIGDQLDLKCGATLLLLITIGSKDYKKLQLSDSTQCV